MMMSPLLTRCARAQNARGDSAAPRGAGSSRRRAARGSSSSCASRRSALASPSSDEHGDAAVIVDGEHFSSCASTSAIFRPVARRFRARHATHAHPCATSRRAPRSFVPSCGRRKRSPTFSRFHVLKTSTFPDDRIPGSPALSSTRAPGKSGGGRRPAWLPLSRGLPTTLGCPSPHLERADETTLAHAHARARTRKRPHTHARTV